MIEYTPADLDQMILAWALVSDRVELVPFAENYAKQMGWGSGFELERNQFWSALLNAHMRYVEEIRALHERPSY